MNAVLVAVDEWARILHPTPRTPWILPEEGWGEGWVKDEEWLSFMGLAPGDTVPPGTEMVVASVDEGGATGWAELAPGPWPGTPIWPPRNDRHRDKPLVGPRGRLLRAPELRQPSRDGSRSGGCRANMAGWAPGMEFRYPHVRHWIPPSMPYSTWRDDTVYVQTHPRIRMLNRAESPHWNWFADSLGVPARWRTDTGWAAPRRET